MNKFQEALDILSYYAKGYYDEYNEIKPYDAPNVYKETLQKLIDKTTICGLSLDEAIPVIEMYKQLKYTTHQIEPIQDSMMGTKSQYYYDGKHSISQLEKALDKACWHLQEYEKDLKKKDINQQCDTKEQWKDYLLRESEKQ